VRRSYQVERPLAISPLRVARHLVAYAEILDDHKVAPLTSATLFPCTLLLDVSGPRKIAGPGAVCTQILFSTTRFSAAGSSSRIPVCSASIRLSTIRCLRGGRELHRDQPVPTRGTYNRR
jgi:hypothetical protein